MKDVQRVLVDTLVQCPRFVNNTIHLIDLYISKNKMYIDTGTFPTRNARKTASVALDNNADTQEEAKMDDANYYNTALFLLASFCPMLSTVEPARRLHHYFALMERIVLERDINPLPILTAILRYIRLTDVCPQGDWSTGTKILSICRSALITHPTELVYAALGDVLHFLNTYHGDVDTRDRAWLYLQLLTHVERGKLLSILCGTSDIERLVFDFKPKQHRSVVTVPISEFLTLDSSVDKRLALGLRDGGTADIVHMLLVDVDQNNAKDENIASLMSVAPLDILSHYLLFMNSDQEQFEVHMPLRIKYRYTKPRGHDGKIESEGSDEIQPNAAATMDPIYALILEFSRSPDYVPIESINLPYLRRFVEPEKEAAESNHRQDSERFPYMYSLVLTLKPIAPVPTFFNVRLVFNDTKGGMYEGSLQDVKVLFQDLFLPLPLKLVFPKEIGSGGKKAAAYLENLLFTLMWDAVLLPNMGFRQVEKLKRIQCEGAESVKHLMMPKDNVLKLVKENLGPFMIKQHGFELDREIFDPSEFEDAEENWYTVSQDDKQSKEENVKANAKVSDMIRLRVLVVLPPRYHMLFKFHISETSTVVRIRTDRWQLLGELDRFFENW